MNGENKICPLFSIVEGNYRHCIGSSCAWFREPTQECAFAKLADEVGYIPGYLSQIAHHFD